MRTKSAGATAIIANPSHGATVSVAVYDAAGVTPYTLSAQTFPTDPVLDVKVTEAVDGPRTATVMLQRQQGARSLAPLVTTGNPVAGLVDVGRRIVITSGVCPPDSESTFETITIFDGFIDEVTWPDDELNLTCTDKTAKLRDTWVEVERAYGFATGAAATRGVIVWNALYVPALNDLVVPSQASFNGHFYKVTGTSPGGAEVAEPPWTTGAGSSIVTDNTFTEVGTVNETGTAVETVIQQVINDAGLSAFTTLQTPVSPSWLIRPYTQQRSSVADAIKALIDQLGWTCRFEWSAGLGKYELTLKQPNRSATTADKTLTAYEESKSTSLGVDVFSIRNAVRVTYSSTANRTPSGVVPRLQVEITDATSIAKYGRRYMEVQESSTSQIDSSAEASRMCQAIVDDLKEPTLAAGISFRVDPYLEIGDMIAIPSDGLRFTSAQTLAVDSLTHAFTAGATSTEVKLRGKPASNRAGWLELDARLNPSDVHATQPLESTGALTVSTSSVVGGVVVALQPTLAKEAASQFTEIHISESTGFTPGPSTLKASGAELSFTLAQLVPGKTYYMRVVPYSVDAGGQMVRGQPGPEIMFVAGQAQAGHIEFSAVAPAHLPPNAMFRSMAASGTVPDQWEAIAKGAEPAESFGLAIGAGSVNRVENVPSAPRTYFIELAGSATVRGRLRSSVFHLPSAAYNAGYRLIFSAVMRTGTPAAGKGLVVTVESSADPLMSSLVTTTTYLVGGASLTALQVWEFWIPVASGPFMRLSFEKESIDSSYTLAFARPSLDRSVEAWTAVAAFGSGGTISVFLNSWANYGLGFQTVAFYKDPFGVVRLRGTLTAAFANRFLAMFTLPTGYRPSASLWFGSGADARFARITVNAAGSVFMEAADSATPSTYVTLDGITFDTR